MVYYLYCIGCVLILITDFTELFTSPFFWLQTYIQWIMWVRPILSQASVGDDAESGELRGLMRVNGTDIKSELIYLNALCFCYLEFHGDHYNFLVLLQWRGIVWWWRKDGIMALMCSESQSTCHYCHFKIWPSNSNPSLKVSSTETWLRIGLIPFYSVFIFSQYTSMKTWILRVCKTKNQNVIVLSNLYLTSSSFMTISER